MTGPTPAGQAQPSIWPAVLGAGAAMLVVGFALGWFVVHPLLDAESEAEVVGGVDGSATTTTAAATTTVAADPTAKAHSTGAFQVSFPAGWVARAEFIKGDPDRQGLYASPTLQSEQYVESFLNVARFAGSGQTVDSALDATPPSTRCPDRQPRAAYSGGGRTGRLDRFTGCPNGYELLRVGFAAPDGSVVVVSSAVLDGDESAITRALESFAVPADASTAAAPIYPCYELRPGGDPQRPIILELHNYSGTNHPFSYVDAAGVAVPEGPFEVGSPQRREVEAGDTYRMELPTGSVDYSVTADPVQCVILKPDGFELLTPPS